MSVKRWTGGGGNWSDPANWSDLTVPALGDVVIDQTGQILINDLTVNDTFLLYADPGTSVGLTLIATTLGVASTLETNAGGGQIGLYFANSALQGALLAESGTTVVTIVAGTGAINYGTMATSSNGPAGIAIIDNPGALFENPGVIETAMFGSISIAFGQDAGAVQTMVNQGTIEADAGGVLAIGSAVYGATTSGEVMNTGLIKANAGSVTIDTAVVQGPNGHLTIAYDGEMTVAGKVDGGTVEIQSGMLQFAASPTFASPGPVAASLFNAVVAFTGTTGAIGFGDTPIAEAFNAAADQVIITVAGTSTQIVMIQLDSSRAYAAQDFSAVGSTLQYFHPTAP